MKKALEWLLGVVSVLYILGLAAGWVGIAYCLYWLFSEPEAAIRSLLGVVVALLLWRLLGGLLLRGINSAYQEAAK